MSSNITIRPLSALLISVLLLLALAWAIGILLPDNPVFAASGWHSTESKNVYSIAVSPAFLSDGTVYVGTKNDGIRRSTDSGTTWSQVDEGLPSYAYESGLPSNSTVGALAISPDFQNDNTLFSAAATNAAILRLSARLRRQTSCRR